MSRYGGIWLHLLLLLLVFLFPTDVEIMTGQSICDLLSAINCLSDFYKIRRKINFMVTPCINDIKHFIVHLMHSTLKKLIY